MVLAAVGSGLTRRVAGADSFSAPIQAAAVSKSTFIRIVVVLAVALGLGSWWAMRWKSPGNKEAPLIQKTNPPGPASGAAGTALSPSKAPLPAQGRSAADKAARVDQIKRDYDEVRAKVAAEFSAAGGNFPGGLNAYLRQLALLERAKHEDLAAVLDERELEDLEMRETNAGQTVTRVLGDTNATEEQKREAFRLQREFENEFALTFDLTPAALLARERVRIVTQEKVHALLGDALFASWLRAEGPEFGQMTEFAARQGLPPDAALNLWRARNDLTIQRLELAARTDLTPEQRRAAQEALTAEADRRISAILGAGALESARQEAMGWLPRK